MQSRLWIGAGSLLAAVVLFQLFFRYEYIHQNNSVTLRVDRLTQSSCVMPCIPTPPPTPTPTPTPENYTQTDNEAIQLARESGEDASSHEIYSPSNEWSVSGRYTNDYQMRVPSWMVAAVCSPKPSGGTPCPAATPNSYPIREVCYCDKDGTGYYYEVHLDNKHVFKITGNKVLERRYGLSLSTSTPE